MYPGTLISVVVVFLLAAVICLPSLGLLYVLDQKSLLDSDEGAPNPARR